jgi:hypothetical protein
MIYILVCPPNNFMSLSQSRVAMPECAYEMYLREHGLVVAYSQLLFRHWNSLTDEDHTLFNRHGRDYNRGPKGTRTKCSKLSAGNPQQALEMLSRHSKRKHSLVHRGSNLGPFGSSYCCVTVLQQYGSTRRPPLTS